MVFGELTYVTKSLFEIILILFANLCEEKRLSYDCWRSDLAKSKQIAKVRTVEPATLGYAGSGSDIGILYFRSIGSYQSTITLVLYCQLNCIHTIMCGLQFFTVR